MTRIFYAHLKQYSMLLAIAVLLFVTAPSRAQITITGNQTANALAQTLVGNGVTIMNPSLTCPTIANGIFGAQTTNLGIDSGIILTTGRAQTTTSAAGANGPASSVFPSGCNNTPANEEPLLTALAGVTTLDLCMLEFDFLPDGDTVKFNYVFSSEEYFGFSCSSFNDVFGFFISGPGIVGTRNIAVIPNTAIAVSVNSTTNPTVTGAGNTTLCNNMGPGSPFTQYFVDNRTGTTVAYDGFTTVLTAMSPVIPCSTYHLKLAIADGSDCILDSGVWIKAKSLTSQQISIKPVGGAGLTNPQPYCVRGCLPGTFVFNRPVARNTPLVIKYQIIGNAINGTDYVWIPDSVIIQPGNTQATRTITGITMIPATGPKFVKLRVMNPYACSNQAFVDSAELWIYDSLAVKALNNDTAICTGQTINLDAQADPILSIQWLPSQYIANPTSLHTTATPTTGAGLLVFEVTATLASSGCPPAHDYVNVHVKQEPEVFGGPDRTTCLGVPVSFNVQCDPVNGNGQSYTYKWTSSTTPHYLSTDTSATPTANPTADITYYIRVNPGATGCDGLDTVNVHILPNDFKLLTPDTAICKGDQLQIRAEGDMEFNYNWSPTQGVSDPNKLDPVIKADTTQTYTVVGSYPNCPDMVKRIFVDVQPVPDVNAGPDREMCQWDTLQFQAVVKPDWYTKYSYEWSPSAGIKMGANLTDMIYGGDNSVSPMRFYVRTPAGCVDSDDVNIVVHPGNFGSISPEGPQGICPNDSLDIMVSGGVKYDWTPNTAINNTTGDKVRVYPANKTYYRVLITNDKGCLDTFVTEVEVHPEAVIQLEDEITLRPGESHHADPKGNGLYYAWFPHVGLSDPNIADPIMKPEAYTKYFLTATTEWGCVTTDTIAVYVDKTILDMPNAFAPGSGGNGNLKIIKRGIATLKYFRIFNRWGAKVFETTDIEQGWDGRLNGEPQPTGVYIYTIEAVSDTGEPYVKQGNVTLIR